MGDNTLRPDASASATAGSLPDPGTPTAKVTINAEDHAELLKLRAERASFEQAQKDAAALRLQMQANADALKALQAENAATKTQAEENAKHVAEMRRAQALSDAKARLVAHAERGAINAATRKDYEGDFAADMTAEQIKAESDRQERVLARVPDGAARPRGTNGATAQRDDGVVGSPADLFAHIKTVADAQFNGDFNAARNHVQKTEPAKFSAAYGLTNGGAA